MINVHGGDWDEIKAWADGERQRALDELVEDGVSECRTQFLRGYLKALRDLEDLPNNKPIEVNSSNIYL